MNIRILHNCPSTLHPVSSGVTLGCPNLLRQHLIGRFCLPAHTFYRLAKPPRFARNPKACSRTVAVLPYSSPNPLFSWLAIQLVGQVVPSGRPHPRFAFEVCRGCRPCTRSRQHRCRPQLNAKLTPLNLWGAESPSETEKPSPPSAHLSHRGGREGSGTSTTSLTCFRHRPTTASTILLAAFPSRFLGLGFGAGVARGGPLVVYWQSGECSKTMNLICVDQSDVKTVGRTDIDPLRIESCDSLAPS